VQDCFSEYNKQLQALQDERDEAIEEFMEEHAEKKFKSLSKMKTEYSRKIALATKAGDTEKASSLKEEQKHETTVLEQDCKEKS